MRAGRRLPSSWVALGLLLLLAPSARAQSGYFYLDRVQISGAPDDGFTVFRPYTGKGTRFYGTAVMGYAHNPLRSETVTDQGAVQSRMENPVQGQLLFYPSLGIQLMSRLGVSVTLPIAIYNITGRDPQRLGVGTGGIGDNKAAVHDLRFDLRVRSVETDDGLARFGGGFALFAPTGNPTAFAGDDQVTGWLFGAAEFNFDTFYLSGHIGPHFRPQRSIGGQYGALALGSEVRWALGAYMPLREGKLRVGGELFGSTGLDASTGARNVNTVFSGRNTALEWLAQARFQLEQDPSVYINAGAGTRLSTGYGAPDVRILIGVGKVFDFADSTATSPPRQLPVTSKADHYELDSDRDGYPDTVDKCPTVPEDRKAPNTTDGCPTFDRDGDGLLDESDACPDQAEDLDGIRDDDGCPEEDADNDTVPDVEDRCPVEPGPRNEQPEKNGCNTLTRLNDDGEVELLQAIQFETGKDKIKEESYPILDEVETLLKARPEFRIGVYGHTDNRGTAALNLRLSKGRAAACLKYLIDKGVDPRRLESDGFGATQPLEDNATEAGRTKNRRVEFKILGDSGER